MISQEQANKILDMAVERITENETNPVHILIKKILIHRVMDNITKDCAIIGHKSVFEVYRAALDSLELLVQENLRSEREDK